MTSDPRRGGGSRATQIKQEHFERVLRQEMAIAWATIQKPHPQWTGWHPRRTVLYIDLNPGPGYVGGRDQEELAALIEAGLADGPTDAAIRGSPLLALRASLDLKIPVKLVLCEKNPRFCRQLWEALIDEMMDWRLSVSPHSAGCAGCAGCDRWDAEQQVRARVTLLEGDHNETIPTLLARHPEIWDSNRPFFGLIYADPYGLRDLPIGPMQALSRARALRRVEILVNVSATAYKRVRRAGQPGGYLFDDLASIERAHRWIREPAGQWQWTMMLATNTPAFKPLGRLKFHDVRSTEGSRLLTVLNLSAGERTEGADEVAAS